MVHESLEEIIHATFQTEHIFNRTTNEIHGIRRSRCHLNLEHVARYVVGDTP